MVYNLQLGEVAGMAQFDFGKQPCSVGWYLVGQLSPRICPTTGTLASMPITWSARIAAPAKTMMASWKVLFHTRELNGNKNSTSYRKNLISLMQR